MLTGSCKALIALSRAGAAAAMIAVAAGVAANGSVVLAKEPAMSVTKSAFGKLPDGAQVDLYTLKNARGVTVKIMTYGGIITSLKAPDRRGQPGEVQLGFDTLDEYLKGHPYFGALCGRVANRIAGGRFAIDGKTYQLATNNGPNHLHGGEKGFDKKVWKAEPIEDKDRVGVELTYVSPDGEEGYPGTLSTTVVYSLTDKNELTIDYTAETDKPTPINLTNHTYWNLADGGKSDVLAHRLTLKSSRYLPVDATMIPTGEVKSVTGTPMDFTRETAIGARIEQVGGEPGGYDHCYVLDKQPGEKLSLAARLVDPASGRVMEVFTTEPAIQLYTGNFLDGTLKSRGATFGQRHAVCLETQHYPDSINQPKFPSTLLKPGQTYRHTTMHRFSTLAAE
ncbi:MAG TPA: aldose epimerase family protein [Pirellulales bacterium]|nr:aldose epimerase family protein [Pirellulales bacterium]